MKTSIVVLVFLIKISLHCVAQNCDFTAAEKKSLAYSCVGNLKRTGRIAGDTLAISSRMNVLITEDITDESAVVIDAHGSVTINGNITGHSIVNITCSGPITVNGKIDGASIVKLNTTSNILIEDKVDSEATIVSWHASNFKAINGTGTSTVIQY